MRLYLLLVMLLPVSIQASTIEEQAKTLIDRLDAAQKAKDADAMGRLLSDDCVVIMTDPSGGARAVRFFPKQAFLEAFKKRIASIATSSGSSTIQSVSSSPSGEVFVARDTESRSRVGSAVDWVRAREYFILRPIGDQLKIRLVVTEAVFYFPEVPPEPPK